MGLWISVLRMGEKDRLRDITKILIVVLLVIMFVTFFLFFKIHMF